MNRHMPMVLAMQSYWVSLHSVGSLYSQWICVKFYLNYLQLDYRPHLCCCYQCFDSCALQPTSYINPCNLQWIPSCTMYLIYRGRLFLFHCPSIGISWLVLSFSTAHLLFTLFPLNLSTHRPALWLNLLCHQIHEPLDYCSMA